MVVRYLTKEEKEEHYKKYPFLKEFLEGHSIEYVGITKCKEFPEKENGCEQLTHDYHYMNTKDFEDENNFYRVIDDNLVVDYDDDKIPAVSDHDVRVYVKPKNQPTLVVLSGPSCVGKDPIVTWMKKMYCPNLAEVRVKKEKTHGAEGKSNIDEIVNRLEFDCRGTRQAIDLDELDDKLSKNEVVLLQAYYKPRDDIIKLYNDKAWIETVFITPFSKPEIEELGDKIKTYLPEFMYRSLLRRTKNENTELTDNVLNDLSRRAEDSLNEITIMNKYKHIITNHHPEGDPVWDMPFLIGEPKTTVDSLYDKFRNQD